MHEVYYAIKETNNSPKTSPIYDEKWSDECER